MYDARTRTLAGICLPNHKKDRREVLGMWKALDTIGTGGSEEGIIQKDEEYDGSARITIETCPRHGDGSYAITCGVYGSMGHTAFGKEDSIYNMYESMKIDLQNFVDKMDDMSEDERIEFYETFTGKY